MKTLIIKRPWGQFEQFTKNEQTSVKIHTFNSNGAWSFQYHERRKEFYKIISGNPQITVGDKKTEAKPGDEFMVEIGEKHRVEAGPEGAALLEICFGDFDEEDIVRLEDNYGRA